MLKLLVKVLQFFPSVTFGILGDSEVFPYALFRSFTFRKFFSGSIVILSIFFGLSIFYGVIYWQSVSFEIIRSLFAYLNVIFIFYVIVKYDTISENFIRKIIFGLLLLGVIQYFGIISSVLDPFIKFLVPRASGSLSLDSGGRGIGLLSTEQQRAHINTFFIYLLLRRYLSLSWIHDVLFIFLAAILIRSATGLFLSMSLFLFVGIKRALTYGVVAVFTSVLLLRTPLLNDIRSFTVLKTLINNVNGVKGVYDILISESGFRLPSLISAYKYSMSHVFGGGIGFWRNTSLVAYNESGLNPSDIGFFVWFNNSRWVSIRPASFMSNIALDMGISGIVLISGFIYNTVKKHLVLSNSKVYLLIFVLYLFFFGEAGNPVPWISSAYILKYEEKDFSYN